MSVMGFQKKNSLDRGVGGVNSIYFTFLLGGFHASDMYMS